MGVIKININTIVNYINERLAGEQLLYSQLLVFLDGTIDDINQALNSNFPAFSEFSEKDENYPDYNFFPDRYIRTVVVTGACAKFYICDEEGAAVAEQYQKDNLKFFRKFNIINFIIIFKRFLYERRSKIKNKRRNRITSKL